ncbi:MAG TPA: hypothetical protein VFX59_11770, partial [Polyangiales bacterium]|nr:hypothetical protein [Polyangiales bacterium]
MSSAVSLLALVAAARADDVPLRLMHEPIPYTDVSDAFDVHDRFDIDIHLDYTHLSDRGTIYREARAASGAVSQQKVGESEIDRNLLTLEVDLGLWRDVMAFVRMPLVLSDTRFLQGTTGSALAGSDGNSLFNLPVRSASRAGLD